MKSLLGSRMTDIKSLLEKYRLTPDPLKDQFFLTNEEIIKKMVGFANLNKKDIVLEVGAGIGNLTAEIAKKARKVIAFEADKRFKPFLSSFPKNVEVYYENAWEYVQLRGKRKKRKEYNKVISSLPYSFVEQFLHNLTFLEYDKVILVVPAKFVNKIERPGVFSSFFKTKILLEVPKENFYPVPRSNSLIIDLIKLQDPAETKNLGLFLRQYMYQHESQLVKNSLMEGIIKYSSLVHSKKVTKNEARRIVAEKGVSNELLESPPKFSEIYKEVSRKF